MEMLALVFVIASIFGMPEDGTFSAPPLPVSSEAEPILFKDLFGHQDVLPPPSGACLCARVCGRAEFAKAGPCHWLRDELVYDAYGSCECGPVSRPHKKLREKQTPQPQDVIAPNR